MPYRRKIIRPIRIDGDIAFVPLTKGFEAIIDAEDVPLFAARRWRILEDRKKAKYAGRREIIGGKRKNIRMHHVILPPKEGYVIDHIDRNGLNNRRSNLRYATVSQNNRNTDRCRNTFQGIYFDKPNRVWIARIDIGRFKSEDEAIEAMIEARMKLGGELFDVWFSEYSRLLAAKPK